jgi:multiple sugar transport system substrate-binding protein
MRNKWKIFLGGLLALSFFVLISGCGCKPVTQKYTVDLEVWGPVDDTDSYAEIFNNYRKLNPNVGNIVYKKQRIETYQQDLIDALASGNGPDIFLMHNDWLANFSNKIAPAPKDILTEQKFRQNFVDVAVTNFVSEGNIFAVPLSVNSLALFYNKDLFNAAGIALPPQTWDEFVEDAVKLTRINSNGELTQAGAAIGTAYNINRSTDILNLLMLQNDLSMVDATGRLNFGREAGAKTALEFYAQFAKSNSGKYVWNPTLHNSIDAFSEGTLGMMLNYSWQIATLRNKSPKLNFAVSGAPQFPGVTPVNFANYWAYGVAKNKATKESATPTQAAPVSNDLRIAEAWKFLTYLTTKGEPQTAQATATTGVGRVFDPNFDPAENYLKKTNQPSARRDLIERQKSDPELGVFAQGNLIAKDWQKDNPLLVETVFAEMIDAVNRGMLSISDAVSGAERKLTKTGY